MATGRVDAIIARDTRAGVFYDLQISGKKYGVGKYAPRDIKEGDFVSFEVDVKQNGQYTNYDIRRGSLRKDDGAATDRTTGDPPVTQTQTAPAKQSYVAFDERQKIISTQAAVNTALQFVVFAAAQGAVPVKATKAADQLSLLRQWVLDEAQRFYKLSTNRDLDTTAVTEELVEGTISKPRAPAKPKPEADPAQDSGYDEYPSE